MAQRYFRYRETPPPNEKMAKIYPKYILPSLILNSDFLWKNRPTFSRPSSKIESLSCTTAIFLVTWSVDFRIKYFGKEDFSHPLSVPLARSLQLANLEKCEKWISQEKCNGIFTIFTQFWFSGQARYHCHAQRHQLTNPCQNSLKLTSQVFNGRDNTIKSFGDLSPHLDRHWQSYNQDQS